MPAWPWRQAEYSGACGDPILNLHSRAGFHSDLGSVLNFRSWLPGGKHICSRQDPARIAHGMNFFWRRAHLLDPKAGQALQCWLWGDVFVSPTSHSWELATTQFHVYINGDTVATVAASTLQDTPPRPCAQNPKYRFGSCWPSTGFDDMFRTDNMPTCLSLNCEAIELQREIFHPCHEVRVERLVTNQC